MKPVIIITVVFVFLFVPLNVNAISVDEFENLLQEVQTQDDIDQLLIHLFKNTDYLKTCKDLDMKMRTNHNSDATNWEQLSEDSLKSPKLDCSGQKVYWEDAPEQYSDSECRILMSDFNDSIEIMAELEQEWWIMVQQEREENDLYFQETGITRQSDESNKWLENTEFDELQSLKNSAFRDYLSYCSGSLTQGCEEKYEEESILAQLENPTFDDSVREKILRWQRELFCDRDTKLEVWVEKRLDMGLPVSITPSEVQLSSSENLSEYDSEPISKPTCGTGTIEKNGQCVVESNNETKESSSKTNFFDSLIEIFTSWFR